MSLRTLNGVFFFEVLKSGANNLTLNKKVVDELNVFPVPDGDTGENMSMTINSIFSKEIQAKAIGETAKEIAHEMLLGARGNSGVILSRIFDGIAKGLDKKIEANLDEFHQAMKKGVAEAFEAVAIPVEGTILTVLKDGVEKVGLELGSLESFKEYFEILTREFRKSVERTPELLPALKEAGVVDSGGVGLLYIFEGMKAAIAGKAIENGNSLQNKSNAPEIDVSLFDENSELEFGYCTEFLMRLQNKKIDIKNFDLDDFSNYLKSVGSSVVAFKDGSIVKVHVHAKNPGEILSYCQKFGEFLKLKIENMTLQHNGALIENHFEDFKSKPHKKYGIVAVANGEGLVESFKEIGCDVVINGGQSMNPSTNDFLEAFDEMDADTIFVFPNNKNIIMAAEQARSVTEKDVRILKTKTIGEGYAAISMFDAETENPEELIESLAEIIRNVKTGLISKASRDTKTDGVEVFEGDFIGFSEGKILIDQKDREEALIELAEKLETDQFDIAILVFGENVKGSEAEKLLEKLKTRYNRTEFYLIDGGQPIYDFILILE